ncbi:twin-arginine translocation signal domain-containing protein [Halorarius litoreus]|uniref:twin-arginine translocation signal domain-containing protein n=1 Tax=Halorarius litoreus TaxID=2962676 RepID=UPI0020CF80AA|nr:twin-arginine translocation signal domain-containing protein [Halorarius litoreus]
MQRRDVLRAGLAVGAAGLAGCTGLVTTEPVGAPPVLEDRPDAVYFPTHVEGMEMAGMGAGGEYKFALMYSYPHRFWNVNGTSVSRTDIDDADDVHLMATVWDPETKQVLPETGLSIEIEQDGELVSQEVIYPMLSQPMGFHYGANFGLQGDGTYDVTVSVGGVSTRRTGAFEGRFADPADATIELDYTQEQRDEIMYERTPDKAGSLAAVRPMDMMMPMGIAPTGDELPGEVVGEATTGDATLLVASLESPPQGAEGAGYLAVSARTPYNRMVIPAMAMEATVTRDGETVYDDTLTRTLDPDLGYHYGAGVAVEPGDEIELRVTTPPQVARHEGYETAFMQFAPVEVTV